MQQLFRTGKDGRVLVDTVDSRLRIYTIVRLRWIAVLGQLVAICVVSLGLGFSLPIGMCLIAIALSAWLNVFLRILYPARTRLNTSSALPRFCLLLSNSGCCLRYSSTSGSVAVILSFNCSCA